MEKRSDMRGACLSDLGPVKRDSATLVSDAEGRAMVFPTKFVEAAQRRAADRFFEDPGLPEEIQKELREGWDVYQERRRVRAESGAPMPPGGCVLLGESSVYAQCLADFHNALAEILGVPNEAVKLRISEAKAVIADVELPEDWPQGTTHEGQFRRMDADFKRFVQLYLDGLTQRLNVQFWANIKERLVTVYSARSELIP